MSLPQARPPRPSTPLATRDFRLLWVGEAVSALGDQFALIALPWLALVLTGSSLALGGVLALMAVPRALLMVVGGAWVDRLSPRRVMLASNAVRFGAVSVLGAVVLIGQVQPWMLYAFALVFGVADAFFYPAQMSIVPSLVEEDQLQRANGIVQGTAQASLLIGPAIAGAVIAAFAGSANAAPSLDGIAIALFIDAGSFLASIVTLRWIRGGSRRQRPTETSVIAAIREGIAFSWRSPALRVVILFSLAVNLLIVGPFAVGLPVLAYRHLPEGAAAYGIVMSAFGGGSLLGLAVGALLSAPRPAMLGPIVILAIGVAGAGLGLLAFVDSTVAAAALAVMSGASLGYGNLVSLTWLQARIPRAFMGRVMSILMLGSMGLVPISQLVAGAAVQVSLPGVLLVAGGGTAALALGSLALPSIRLLGLTPVVADTAPGAAQSPA